MPLSSPPLLPHSSTFHLPLSLHLQFHQDSRNMDDYNISDLPLGARCSKSRASTDLVVAPFLQRACNRASSTTEIDFSKHRIAGMTPDGYPVVCLMPCLLLCVPGNDPTGVPTHQASNSDKFPQCILPFAPLFQEERAKDFETTITESASILGDARTTVNSNREARRERKVWEILIRQGIKANHIYHHPLDDALAFKNYPSKQTRSSRIVPLECHLIESHHSSEGSFKFFAFPAFRMDNVTISEDV